MIKKALVVISFGTSHPDTRKKTIEACENKIRNEYPDMDFYSAWTSRMIIKKLKKRDGEDIFYPDELFEKLYDEGYGEVYIQSLHLICGEEYKKLEGIINSYKGRFKKMIVGRPLLSKLEDYDEVLEYIAKITEYDTEGEENSATVWMGHGTEHSTHSSYAGIDYRLRRNEINSYIATVEGHPSIYDMIYFLKKDNVKKIHLRPFLLVAGDHAKNDMAGDEEDSWKSRLKKEGFDVVVHLEGIGEHSFVQDKFLSNLREAIEEDSKKYKTKKKASKFYGIGVGPGDHRLMTLKAVDTLKNLDILYVPQSKDGKRSLAHRIASPYVVSGIEIKERHFPMNFDMLQKTEAWDRIAKEIEEDVNNQNAVGFITLGDPMIYSTYQYLLERLRDRVDIETVSGINSFVDISARNNFPLAVDKQTLVVLPSTMDMDEMESIIQRFDSLVLMKVYKNFKDIIRRLVKCGLEGKFLMASNSSMENEKVYYDANEILELDKVGYFTTILIMK